MYEEDEFYYLLDGKVTIADDQGNVAGTGVATVLSGHSRSTTRPGVAMAMAMAMGASYPCAAAAE